MRRYDIFGELMSQMHQKGVLQHSALVLEAYLKVLGALAITQEGAAAMYMQMQQGPPVSPVVDPHAADHEGHLHQILRADQSPGELFKLQIC